MGVMQRTKQIREYIKKKYPKNTSTNTKRCWTQAQAQDLGQKKSPDDVSKSGHSYARAQSVAGTALRWVPELLGCLPAGILMSKCSFSVYEVKQQSLWLNHFLDVSGWSTSPLRSPALLWFRSRGTEVGTWLPEQIPHHGSRWVQRTIWCSCQDMGSI